MTRYKKEYRDPHAQIKAELAAILALALAQKKKALLEYVAENDNTDGLLDYADTVLESGWEKHFSAVAALLAAAAVDSALEALDASGRVFSEEFIANIEKHVELTAKHEAADVLGLSYDPIRDIARPTLNGWTPAKEAVAELKDTIATVEKESAYQEFLQQQQQEIIELPPQSARIEQAIDDMSLFSGKRAEQYALNAITYVSGASARSSAAAAGASLKRSETVGDDRVCDDCAENERDGWIAINDPFSGSETIDTPHHPNCRCSVEYEWAENMRTGPSAPFVLQEAA